MMASVHKMEATIRTNTSPDYGTCSHSQTRKPSRKKKREQETQKEERKKSVSRRVGVRGARVSVIVSRRVGVGGARVSVIVSVLVGLGIGVRMWDWG
jgi:hypothetical protein